MAVPRSRPARRSIEWDDGVASERTVLSWERTAISSIVVGMLVLRAGILDGPLGLALPVAALLLAAAGWEWQFSHRLYLQHDRPFAHGAVLHEVRIAVLTAVTVLAAGAALALSLIG